ncbi:MAG: acyl-CoA dehydratase activase [Thermodesulfobacteriota bacterium]
MIAVGLDMGSKYIKAVALLDREVIGRCMLSTEFDRLAAARKSFERLLKVSDIPEDRVNTVIATGAGKKVVSFAQKNFTVVACVAKAAVHVFPRVRTIIDVGAEEARAVRLDDSGRVLESAVNEKCGAGAGAFVESMARAMEVDVEEFARLSLKATRNVPINAQCVIFAESEVVSLVHADTAREDIAKAVHDAMASRVGSMAQRVRIQKDVAMCGGVANNVGFVRSVKEFLKEDMLVPESPEYMTALGAALLGFERV